MILISNQQNKCWCEQLIQGTQKEHFSWCCRWKGLYL